jgi:hypothetical protein
MEIDIPDSIRARTEELYKKQKERDVLEKKLKDEHAQREDEEAKLRQERGLADATFVFEWASELLKTEVVQKLIQTKYGWSLRVYAGNTEDSYVGWRALTIREDGLGVETGGKSTSYKHVTSPTQLADLIDYRLLKEAHSCISDGQFWNTIFKEIDRSIAEEKKFYDMVYGRLHKAT